MVQPIVKQLSALFDQAIFNAVGFESPSLVAPAQNKTFGDYQCNAAMGLVKKVSEISGQKTPPRQIAETIISNIEPNEIIDSLTIAGPGFINISLKPIWIENQIVSISENPKLGIENTSTPLKIIVDYSGPNIAKQMHVGHLRSTIIGDCIARVLEFRGNDIIRQNHLGDWGTQFGMLITHLQDLSGNQERFEIHDLEGFYREAKERFDNENEFQNRARATVVRLQSGESAEINAWKHIVNESKKHFHEVYGKLNVDLKSNDERGESFYNEFLGSTVNELVEKEIAVSSEGAVVIFNDKFETPLLIKKSDGGYLYGTTDLAAIRYRVNSLEANRIIYVHDARQSQHFTQVFDAAFKANWSDSLSLEFAPFGTMLGEDGKPFKTRSGGTVKLIELLDEAQERAYNLVSEKNPDMPEQNRKAIAHAVGIGAVKYSDLSKDRTGDYIFAWDKMISMDGNTGPYLQYAYTRIRSIFRKASADENFTLTKDFTLTSDYEVDLAKLILRFSEIIEILERELKPHHLCNYLYEVSGAFNAFYEHCPVLQSEGSVKSSRLLLCQITANTLHVGLKLLGIPVVEKM